MANAQDKIQFGVRAGMNIYSLSGEDGDDFDSRVGYHIGAVMDWNVAKNLYVQPGIYFTMRGTKEGGGEGQYKLSSNPYFGSVSFSRR